MRSNGVAKGSPYTGEPAPRREAPEIRAQKYKSRRNHLRLPYERNKRRGKNEKEETIEVLLRISALLLYHTGKM